MYRRLKPNCGNSLPRQLIFFDCETLPGQTEQKNILCHQLRLGVAQRGTLVNGELTRFKECVFFTAAELWKFVFQFARPKTTTWLIAHSACFDLAAAKFWELWDKEIVTDEKTAEDRCIHLELTGRRFQGGTVVLQDPPTILRLVHRASGSKFVVVDSLNYFRCSVADLGDALALPKLPMPAFSEPDYQWIDYCRRDVEIVRESFLALTRFVKGYRLGNLAKTGPAQAMNAFRHRFMKHQIDFHDREDVKQLERASYYGGETRLFYRGKIKATVHQCDVTSLFPAVMLGGHYPCRLQRWEMREAPLALPPTIRLRDSIAQVVLKDSPHTLPVRIEGQTRYVTGSYTTTLAGPELSFAWRNGLIAQWGSWAEYNTQPLFRDYVQHFWQLRQRFHQQGNTLFEQFAKLLLNSLYGKFGQRSCQWQHEPGRIPEIPWSQWTEIDATSGERCEWRAIGERCERQVVPHEVDGNFPAIAAFVTSYARQHMRRLRSLLGERDLYYQGVDSLIVSQDGFSKLMAAGKVARFELGKLRYEASAEGCEIIGPHNYDFGDKVVAPGIKASAIDLGGGQYRQDRFRRVGGLFRQVVPQGVETWQETKRRTTAAQGATGWLESPHASGESELR